MRASSFQAGESPHNRRRSEWLAVAVALPLAMLLWTWRGEWNRPKTVVEADITLITSDRDELACAMSREVEGGYRCEFRVAGEPWSSQPAPANRLAPYYTVDRRMFLVPGLFEQPALAARLTAEPPANKPRESLRRFVANCKLRLVERTADFQVRWERSAEWGPGAEAWVAKPITCRVID